eukprot:5218341-Pyramimonas_sp.AAC.2
MSSPKLYLSQRLVLLAHLEPVRRPRAQRLHQSQFTPVSIYQYRTNQRHATPGASAVQTAGNQSVVKSPQASAPAQRYIFTTDQADA